MVNSALWSGHRGKPRESSHGSAQSLLVGWALTRSSHPKSSTFILSSLRVSHLWTFWTLIKKDGLLSAYFSIPRAICLRWAFLLVPTAAFSSETPERYMTVLENKALISSRKLVQQKLRHCQQPFGVLPTGGHLESGFMWVQVTLRSFQTYLCPLSGSQNAWLRGPGQLVLCLVIVWWYTRY